MKFFTEAIKLQDGVLVNLEYHQSRVDRTTQFFKRSKVDLLKLRDCLSADVATGLFKCRVVYGAKIEKVEFIPYVLSKKKTVSFVRGDEVDYSFKYEDRSVLTKLVQSSGCDDVIIVKDGLVTDASASNLVFESASGILVTPSSCLLAGTKRQYLIDKGVINEVPIRIDEVKNYRKVHFISSMIELEDDVLIDVQDLLFE